MADGEEIPAAGGDAVTTAKSVNTFNIHQAKIDVQKFDGKINFGMWRCEVMDALNSMNLEETLDPTGKPEEVSEKDWRKMNRDACGAIRSYLHHSQSPLSEHSP